MGAALQFFVGQGPCALPGSGTDSGGGVRAPRPTERNKECVGEGLCPYGWLESWCGRADVGIGPYGSVTRSAVGGRPRGSPLLRMHGMAG